MEIRILNEADVARAVELAQGVFDFDLSKIIEDKSLVSGFKEYSSVEHLSQMMRENLVTLWGVFDQGHMCGMSAMQPEGHITMLYVYPVFRRRGYAKQLLHAMRIYAANQYGLKKVTVSAMPIGTAPFFIRNGFDELGLQLYSPEVVRAIRTSPGAICYQPDLSSQPGFINLEAKTIQEVEYPVKRISGKTVGIIVAVTVAAILLIIVAFLLQYHP